MNRYTHGMATDFYNNVSIQMVGDDTSPLAKELIQKSVFLQAAFSLNLSRIIAPGAPDVNTDSLGELWQSVRPLNGKYTFEIATVLPSYLPSFDDAQEYIACVDGAELLITSRMLRCYISETAEHCTPLQYYLVHRLALKHLVEQKKLTHIHPVPLRTFVTKRFEVSGDNAEQIIQNHFSSWVREFVGNLSRLVDSIRAASPAATRHVMPQSSTPFLSVFWVYVQGADDKSEIAQFAGDMPTAAFRPLSNLDTEGVRRAEAYFANGSAIAIQESSLALAQSYLHYGYFGLSLVQVCIACEAVLARTYETFLLSRGVSKTKYADAERDITFSQLLNLHLAAARDLSTLTDRENILSRMNWARKCRNDVVHKGELQQVVTSSEVESAIEAARSLVQFLTPKTN